MIVVSLATTSHAGQAVHALESILATNPSYTRALLLLIDGDVLPGWGDVTRVETIGLRDLDEQQLLEQMTRYYSRFELVMALKTWLLRYVDTQTDAESWIYVDGDVCGYAPLTALERALDRAEVALTYHTRHPDSSLETIRRDLGLCGYGTINGGVLAMRRSTTASAFIEWWRARVSVHGRYCIAEGENADQRWLDMAPSAFTGVRPDRIAGINIGYWSLPELILRDGKLLDHGDTPVALAHFSQVITGPDGASFRRVPRSSAPARAMFEQLAHEYAAAVQECTMRVQPFIRDTGELPVPLDAQRRDVLIRAMHGDLARPDAFARAAARMPALQRERAVVELRAGAEHFVSALRALRRAWWPASRRAS